MNMKQLAAMTALTALTALTACSKTENKGSPPSNGSGDEKAQAMFNQRCAACHGADGKGDGPASAALNPKPRNYTDKAWQASVTDEQISKTIMLGGAAVGKSAIMPASPDLDQKPEVVAGLVKIVRKFGN